MKELTGKQREILDFIAEFQQRETIPPTVYEIAEHFAIKPATSFAHLRALQKKGYVERTSKARSLTLLKGTRLSATDGILRIPVLGRISAGLPLLAEENVEDTLKIDPTFLPWGTARADLFALRVNGESMRDAGILDGDIVIAKASPSAASGDIVVALVDGESTIKYLYLSSREVELRPANPAFQPRVYSPDEVQIQGTFAALIRPG